MVISNRRMQQLLQLIIFFCSSLVNCKLNLLENPSFENSGTWDLWERVSMWKVQPATDSVKITTENPQKGLGSLWLSPPRDFDLQAVIASQYVSLQNTSLQGATSLTMSFQVAGEELKHFRAVLGISFVNGNYMLADLTAHNYVVSDDEDSDFTEVCGYIPAYGQIRAVMLHLVVSREARSQFYVDSVRLLPNQPIAKSCFPYVDTFPRSRQTMVNFLTPPQQFKGLGITLATQLTMDRWYHLEKIAQHWHGPISAAVLIFQEDAHKNMQDLIRFYHKSTILQKYLTVHLVLEDSLNLQDSAKYPANYLRNTALSNIQSAYVFFIDADITPVFSEEITYQSMERAASLANTNNEETKLAFIAPLFHTKNPNERLLPETKDALLDALKGGSFEPMSIVSHAAVKYNKWKVNHRAYEIPYSENMEPYFVVSSDAPMLNDMFVGYGRDKCAYSKELNRAGYRFAVLPDVYLINRKDPPTSATILNRSRKGADLVDLEVFLNAAFHEKDMKNGYFNFPKRNVVDDSLNLLPSADDDLALREETTSQHCVSQDSTDCNREVHQEHAHKYDEKANQNNPETKASMKETEQETEQTLESDGGLGCESSLLNGNIFQGSKLPLKPMAQTRVSTAIEHLAKTFGTWTLVHIPDTMTNTMRNVLVLYHPDALISVVPDHHEDQKIVSGVTEYYFTKVGLSGALEKVREDHHGDSFLFYLRADEIATSLSLQYISEPIQQATDKDMILIEMKDPGLAAIHRQMCQQHSSWKMYKNEHDLVMLKSKDLTAAPPITVPAPPSIALTDEIPKCPLDSTKTDIILMTKNRPLQTLAFLESLHKLAKNVNKVWIVQKTDEEAFQKGYERVVKCMGKHLSIEVLEQENTPIGIVALQALESSEADYAMFAVDELVWTHSVDMNEVGCLLKNSGDPSTSFQLRLGENLGIHVTERQKQEQFITLKASRKIQMYYPLRLQHDFAYVMHIDAMVVNRQVILDDLKAELPSLTTPGSIETAWLTRSLHSRARQWHFMYKDSCLFNNMGHVDGRVAGAIKPSKGSFQLLDNVLIGKKIDIDKFIRENRDKIRYTHGSLPVTYKDWVC